RRVQARGGVEAEHHLAPARRDARGEAVGERDHRSALMTGSVSVQRTVVVTIAPAITSVRKRYQPPITSDIIAVGMAAISTTVRITAPLKPTANAAPRPITGPSARRATVAKPTG